MNEIVERLQAAPIVYKGERCVTLDVIDQMHERQVGTAKNAFNRRKAKFTDGKHFHSVPYGDAVEGLNGGTFNGPSKNARGGHRGDRILLTERGYCLLAKTFDDDRAWAIQEELVDGYFRAQPTKETAPALTSLQMLRLAVDSLENHESRLAVVERDIGMLVARREQATLELRAVERSELPAPEMTIRAKLNQLLRAYCTATGADHSDTWGKLYRELVYRCEFNAQLRAKNHGTKALDEVERGGKMPELFAIASELLQF